MIAAPTHAADLIGAWDWNLDDPDHGGYSAIEMQDGGRDAVVLSDRGRLLDLRIERDDAATIASAAITRERWVRPARPEYYLDTEGLAIAPNGQIFVSFEGPAHVAEVHASDDPARALPVPPQFEALKENRGLEGLAIGPDGALWTVAEARIDGIFPLTIWRAGGWTQGPRLDSDGKSFVPVGLDFDDTGRLYLLERQFLGPFGFRSRLRRITLDAETVVATETLLETQAGQHDNLEGLALWRDDADRLIASMISDDNFFPLQRTELVEYVLPD